MFTHAAYSLNFLKWNLIRETSEALFATTLKIPPLGITRVNVWFKFGVTFFTSWSFTDVNIYFALKWKYVCCFFFFFQIKLFTRRFRAGNSFCTSEKISSNLSDSVVTSFRVETESFREKSREFEGYSGTLKNRRATWGRTRSLGLF